jgi:predicted ATPase/DNA-binding SARP family transcriptional activator
MEIRVLGPIELVAAEGAVPLGAAKQRRLLAALAIGAGSVRSADVLIDALWGERPPPSAAKLLQTYVSQLRKAFPSPGWIRTHGSAYTLDLAAASIDAARFERLLDEGREASVAGNPALAVSLLTRALGLWRGEAYGEFAYEQFAREEAVRLGDLRLACVEERLDAELALGRHLALLPEVTAQAAAQPLRERLQAQLMLALYRAGRQSDALDVYSETRARLLDELGLEPGAELRELQQRILRHDGELSVAQSAVAPPNFVPAPPNRLVGRETELEELRDLLLRDEMRLLVLNGAGGSGKTRLALEAARRSGPLFANGVVFVPLAPLRDPALVLGAIAQAVGVRHRPSHVLDDLVAALRPQELLLVVDNAEHVRDATPLFVELLARAPRLKLLVTSRVVLHLSGEQVYPVQPLLLPDAVTLFCERASAADSHFRSAAGDEPTIRSLCERLDRLPLALELAASRVRTLSPDELLARLDPRLPLLTGGPRDLPARQQTLRATIAWSHELLAPEERRLLACLSVFAGGFSLAAAEQVAHADLDALQALVETHLLRRDEERFAMLETIREYAAEQLDGLQEREIVRRRHAVFVAAIVESANLNAGKLDLRKQARHELVFAEQDNLRGALAWAVDNGSTRLGLEIATSAERFWVTHDPAEGMRWFAALLEHPQAAAVPRDVRAHALRAYGSASDIAGYAEVAERAYAESLALFEKLDDEHSRAVLLHRLALSAMRRGALERARTLVQESHEIHQGAGDLWGQAQTIGTLGAISREAGDERRAAALIEQSAVLARDVGMPWWESGALAELAALSLRAGRIDDAEKHARQALSLAERQRDRAGRVFGLGLLACVAAERAENERAGLLWCAVEHEDAGAPLGGWRRHRAECEAQIRRAAGPEFEVGYAEGMELTLDNAVALVLSSAG